MRYPLSFIIVLFFFLPLSSYAVKLDITTNQSLCRTGTAPFRITQDGRENAEILFKGISKNNKKLVSKAAYNLRDIVNSKDMIDLHPGIIWLADCFLAKANGKELPIPDKYFEYIYKRFEKNNYSEFKELLQRAYGIDFTPKNTESDLDRMNELTDLIMFNNPYRDKWASPDKLIKMLNINKGDILLDIGCGFGYYTHYFAELVGKEGRIFAIDTVKEMAEESVNAISYAGYSNVHSIISKNNDISVKQPSDIAFISSLYHIIYTWSNEADRQGFIRSIKHSLKPNGRLVIVDNYPLLGEELNSCYIYPELIKAQLHFYGFDFEKIEKLTHRQYVMFFRHREGSLSDIKIGNNNKILASIEIDSGKPLLHIGSLDSYDVTEKGMIAARLAYKAICSQDKKEAERAVLAYDNIIPIENFGGEYTAIRWLCQYIMADENKRVTMISNTLNNAYYHYLADNKYETIKTYIKYKYKLEPVKIDNIDKDANQDGNEIGKTRRAALEDFILFNNPYREVWEKSDSIMDAIQLKPGEVVADIGSGPGYYSYRFADKVTNKGVVYALDIKKEHLAFISSFNKTNKITNVFPVESRIDDIMLIENSVDCAYMCSLYHIIYGVNSYPERDRLLKSIRKAIKKNGRLVIVDNGPVNDTNLPYHGPYIHKDLIIAQLAEYGFQLKKFFQHIPQRFYLEFTLINK